jgi:hypothetical protein
MIKKNIYIFLFLIFLNILIGGIIYSQDSLTINDENRSYISTESVDNFIELNLNDDCNIDDSKNVNIESYITDPFSHTLYCNLDRKYTGYFSTNFSTNNPNPPVPNILVGQEDTVIVTYSDLAANLVVDTVSPVIGTFNLISLEENIDDFYKGDVNVIDISGFSDNHSGIYEYTVYISPLSENYKGNAVLVTSKIVEFGMKINLDLPSQIPDGNYFVLLDARDKSLNTGNEETVIENKKILNLDNSPPEITSFNLGDFQDGETYYVTENQNILTMLIEDSGVGVKAEPLFTQLDRDSVKLVDYNSSFGGFYFDFNTVEYNISGNYELSATDLLGNNTEKSFSVVIDTTSPTTPTVPTITRSIDNNVTISNWGSSTDADSGLKEYKVYRSSSSFTNITNQTVICTVLASATKSCIDSSSKTDNTVYYYGVSAIDNAGNQSPVIPVNIKTGPSLSVEIDLYYSGYVKTSSPNIELEYSSDVNAVRFSCNGTSFTSWQEVSGTSTTHNSFNITSGNGCTTSQGDKIVYVEVKSETSPYPITRKSVSFKYDSQGPTTPTNVTLSELTDGSVNITWNSSTDEGSGLKEYRVYYSELNNITTSSPYFTTSNNTYTYKPNIDGTFYFKISARDNVLNESTLSSVVSGDTSRYGATFIFNVNPKNQIDDLIYIKKGITSFTITSDKQLKQTPVVRLKIGNLSYQNLSVTQNNLNTNFDYNFQTDGNAILEVTGITTNNETSTDTFEFIVDVNAPDFDANYLVDESNFTFDINNFSQDVFRVQFLLNNNEEICFLENLDEYNCVLDSLSYDDGDYKMHIFVYDKALNITTKILDFKIDNVDETEVLKDTLLDEITENRKIIENKMLFYNSISLEIEPEIINKFNLAKEKISEANLLQDTNSFVLAIEEYTAANNLLLEIIDSLPEEKILKTKTMVINLKNNSHNLNEIILDQNILQDNLNFYDVNNLDLNKIIVTREFSVFEIFNQNYYSSVLNFENNTDSDIVISFIEIIPKEFTKNAENIYFDRDVIIIDDDPIILYNLTIPKNTKVSTKYISKEVITSFDILTKFESIVYQDPLLLTGFLTKEDINFSKSMFDKNFLFLIAVILLVIIIIVVVIWVVISSKNKKEEVFKNIDAKDSMNKYLGDKLDDKNNKDKKLPEQNLNPKSDIENKNDYESNYDFILNAVKRDKK